MIYKGIGLTSLFIGLCSCKWIVIVLIVSGLDFNKLIYPAVIAIIGFVLHSVFLDKYIHYTPKGKCRWCKTKLGKDYTKINYEKYSIKICPECNSK